MNTLESLEVIPTGRALGAEVVGIDFTQPLDSNTKEAIRQAWLHHLVLRFRRQALTPQQYLQAIRVFGEPQPGAAGAYYQRAGRHSIATSMPLPEITILSNLDEHGNPVHRNDSLGSEEVVWHSDNSYIDKPPAGSTLYSREIPDDDSGQTSFANQYLALDELPVPLRAAIDGKCSKQDASRNSAGVLRPGVREPTCPEDVPGPMHPLIRIHPETKRAALYLGRRRAWPSQYIQDLSNNDSEALLDALWAHATKEAYTWTHHWALGDMLVWDNRCVMHRREAVNPKQRRVMWRSQFQGEPVLGV